MIPYFIDLKEITLLGVQPLNDTEVRENLKVRGQKFVTLRGMHYLEYKGNIIVTELGRDGVKLLHFEVFSEPLIQ